ncbi:MAG: GTPase Era [Desulfomonile sp.]|nr:GTPase Era [Desulfomonile sp.]
MSTEPSDGHRCGFIAVAGRPNVGKSTLVNAIVGQELCVVTPKAQTTRNRITAIHTTPDAQVILVDTPGIHEATTPLNKALVAAAIKTLEGSDIALMLVTPSEEIPEEDRRIIDALQNTGKRGVLAINKIDTVAPSALLPVIEMYSRAHGFQEIVPISALNGSGVPELLQILVRLLPVGPPLFPEDDVSDLPVRFFVSEIVREQVIVLTGQEIPYKTAVAVESFKEKGDMAIIHAEIHVERQSQKKIIIGKGGEMIKHIGTRARLKIEEFLQRPVHLDLFVKVSPHWTRDPNKIAEFGYGVK